MSKDRLLEINNIILNDLKRKHKGCTAEDMKAIFLRHISEQENKIKRIKDL
jgi:hypothetical protein